MVAFDTAEIKALSSFSNAQSMLYHSMASIGTKSKRKLTYFNVVPTCVEYIKSNALNGNLKDVIQHLIENTDFVVGPTLQKALCHKRVSYYLDNDFQFCLGRCDLDMSWWEPPLKKTKRK